MINKTSNRVESTHSAFKRHNKTSNRVESTHSAFKRHNKTSSGSLNLVTRRTREWVEERKLTNIAKQN
ncbi:hypothetical protein A0J61_09746 [Choanephora cucurbitarum]|uniref:Uncharacterized protein n=1 Tax=Choanephora cucurbitarum TaxID=101091 RepID=A0A1C7MZJ8_9FUNG|nr:hypothetical protein A0J61_09746 [Choanephora cucurbitarum]